MTEKMNKQCNEVVDNSTKFLRTYQDMQTCCKTLIAAANNRKTDKPGFASFMDLILADGTKFSKALDKLIKIVEGIATDPGSVDFKKVPKVIEQFNDINGRWAELEDWADRFELKITKLEAGKKKKRRITRKTSEA